MRSKERLLEYKIEIESILKKYFDNKIEESKDPSQFVKEFMENLSEYTLRGGKRLRPALIYYTYVAYGGHKNSDVKELSGFIELVQSFLLIHDDIMDRDVTRRNGPTFHKIYEDSKYDNYEKDNEHFGRTMAILSGDLVCQFAYEMISNSNFDNETIVKVTRVVSDLIGSVIYGQINDILLPGETEKTREQVMAVYENKTATYTYEIPVQTGAILAKVDESEYPKIREFSRNAGIAFQIRDDYLGLFGDKTKTGKSNNSDIAEGKGTMFVIKAYENANDEQKIILDKYLGKNDITQEESDQVRNVIIETGALDAVRNLLEDYVRKSHSILETFDCERNEGYDFIYDIVEYMSIREL